MQIIKGLTKKVFCRICQNDLTQLGHFEYLQLTDDTPVYKDEHCTCNRCGTEFLLRYELFTPQKHINPLVFSQDINDPTFNWQDQFTKEQLHEIQAHLKTCKRCSNILEEELLSDAWFANFMHQNSPQCKSYNGEL
jgi:hypothetical protein